MLSRIAESLYWMGRYIERADDTARLLDVHVHRMLGDAGDRRVGATLLAAMGLSGSVDVTDVDLWQATELLAYDGSNPSSVAGSLELARTNASGLREVLATEESRSLAASSGGAGATIPVGFRFSAPSGRWKIDVESAYLIVRRTR